MLTPPRAIVGLLVAAAIAVSARRAGSLSTSGVIAATGAGAAAIAAGWNWGGLLITYFITSSLLTRLGRADKERRTGGVVAKGGPRDAAQVLANGGAFAACALLSAMVPVAAAPLTLAALGALAASTADTWATEIGTQLGRAPRSVTTLRRLTPGTSGGVSAAGSLAMLAGAAFLAFAARAFGLTTAVTIVAIAGVAGAVVDSLLGATVQERRWCPACDEGTEQRRHACGAATTHAGGREWMGNDLVNLLATVTGGAVAALLATL